MSAQLAVWLPRFNAACNLGAAICLGVGLWAIRRRQVRLHRAVMLAALLASSVFLVGYLTRLGLFGSHRFRSGGAWRTAYLCLLGGHTVLAVGMLPFIGVTLARALGQRFALHRKVARWTWPVWMVVSVSGVGVYLALYHLDPYLLAQAALAADR